MHTKLGAIETTLPELYKHGLPDKKVLRVDALYALEDILDKDMYNNRTLLYELLSGSRSTNEMYRRIFEKEYIGNEKFRFYVDSKFLFKLPDEDLLTCVIKPLRILIDEWMKEVEGIVQRSGGKLLMVTHDYMYFSFKHDNIPTIKGSVLL